jgi:hypothetical protein
MCGRNILHVMHGDILLNLMNQRQDPQGMRLFTSGVHPYARAVIAVGEFDVDPTAPSRLQPCERLV